MVRLPFQKASPTDDQLSTTDLAKALKADETEFSLIDSGLDGLVQQRSALLLEDGTDKQIDELDEKLRAEQRRHERIGARIPKLKELLAASRLRDKDAERKVVYAKAAALLDARNKSAPEFERRYNALIAELLELQDLIELAGKVNRDLPDGEKPLELPLQAVRYSPAPPAPPKRMVERTRLKDDRNNQRRLGGDDSYVSFKTLEEDLPPSLASFREQRAFEPEPLTRTVVLPSFRKGGPSFRPS